VAPVRDLRKNVDDGDEAWQAIARVAESRFDNKRDQLSSKCAMMKRISSHQGACSYLWRTATSLGVQLNQQFVLSQEAARTDQAAKGVLEPEQLQERKKNSTEKSPTHCIGYDDMGNSPGDETRVEILSQTQPAAILMFRTVRQCSSETESCVLFLLAVSGNGSFEICYGRIYSKGKPDDSNRLELANILVVFFRPSLRCVPTFFRVGQIPA